LHWEIKYEMRLKKNQGAAIVGGQTSEGEQKIIQENEKHNEQRSAGKGGNADRNQRVALDKN